LVWVSGDLTTVFSATSLQAAEPPCQQSYKPRNETTQMYDPSGYCSCISHF